MLIDIWAVARGLYKIDEGIYLFLQHLEQVSLLVSGLPSVADGLCTPHTGRRALPREKQRKNRNADLR